jgi:hypothetical protein
MIKIGSMTPKRCKFIPESSSVVLNGVEENRKELRLGEIIRVKAFCGDIWSRPEKSEKQIVGSEQKKRALAKMRWRTEVLSQGKW